MSTPDPGGPAPSSSGRQGSTPAGRDGGSTGTAAGSALVEDLPVPHSDHEEGPRAGRPVRLAGALVPLLFGLVTLLGGLRLGVGSPQDPGPGMWPVITSVGIVACGVVLLLTERDQGDYEKYTRGAAMNLLGVVTLVLYVVLLPNVGVEVSTLALTAVWLKVLGGESWRTTVVMSLAITASVYVLFVALLGAPIPRLLAI